MNVRELRLAKSFGAQKIIKGSQASSTELLSLLNFGFALVLLRLFPCFFPFGTKKYLAYFLFYRMLQLRDWIFRETLKILEGFELCNFEYFIEIELLKRLKI